MSDREDTWERRDLPILLAAYRRFEAGERQQISQLQQIREELGFAPVDFVSGLEALAGADPPYLELETGGGWSQERTGGGYVTAISERARRDLGAWPSPEALLEQLVAALARAADEEQEPERKGRLRAAADTLGGMAREIAVSVIATRIARL